MRDLYYPRSKPPTRREAVSLLRRLGKGSAGVWQWNAGRRPWRNWSNWVDKEWVPNLTRADFARLNLSHADLTEADLRGANLESADLSFANLSAADLQGANLKSTNLIGSDLSDAILNDADLSEANCGGAKFRETVLRNTRIRRIRLLRTTFEGVDLLNIRDVADLQTCLHDGPCYIDTQTFKLGKGAIPTEFIRQCGHEKWEAELARLYDPMLGPTSFTDRLYSIFDMRMKGPIGGVFISYAHTDERFVSSMESAIRSRDINVWRDVHNLAAGPLAPQVLDAIRRNDVVLLVLSQSSLRSDWVEFEINKAREREKAESRDILCPVAIDDSWKTAAKTRPLLSQLAAAKVILSFVPDEPIEGDLNVKSFEKLIRGMKLFYGNGEGPTAS